VTLSESSAAGATLANWKGGWAQPWDYTASHGTLRIKIARRGEEPCVVLSLKDCSRVSFAASWDGFYLTIETYEDALGIYGALIWVALLLSLVAAWWLLLAYFYKGPKGASQVPVPVWIFAGVVALLASLEFAVGGDDSPLQGLAVGVLFVPTFLHLVGEVWVWRPNKSLERTRGR